MVNENDALASNMLFNRIVPHLIPVGEGIARSLRTPEESNEILFSIFHAWTNTIARLCIGLRRLGTGGSYLITPTTPSPMLNISYQLPYNRLGDSLMLGILDSRYDSDARAKKREQMKSGSVSSSAVIESSFAEADAQDRESEITGAVKLATSLASVDGAVLLSPLLEVIGFGVKIGSGTPATTVYDGSDFVRKGVRAKKINLARFGTRHSSMLRYCRSDPTAVGIVVSQDGHVRVMMTSGKSLVFWDNVKLLQYSNYSAKMARNKLNFRLRNRKGKYKRKLGYTSMPKTIAALLARK